MRNKAQQDAGSTLPGFTLFLALFMIPVLAAVQSEPIARAVGFSTPELYLPYGYFETARTVHGLKLSPLSGSFKPPSSSELEDAEVYLDKKQDAEVEPGNYCNYTFSYKRLNAACDSPLVHVGNDAYGASTSCQTSISAISVGWCKSLIDEIKGLLPASSCSQDFLCQINRDQSADISSHVIIPLGHVSADQAMQL